MTKHITVASICMALAGLANAQRIISFDVPGATGTSAAGILPTGEIVGRGTTQVEATDLFGESTARSGPSMRRALLRRM